MGIKQRRRKTKEDEGETSGGGVASSTKKNAKRQVLKWKAATKASSSSSSAWAFVRQHWAFPLFVISGLVLIPYGLYLSSLYIPLQHPEILLPFWKLRPPVGFTDLRQLLVVGSMSSGTSQVAHDLSKTLQLEIGHENAETMWSFVRDGTVSWFHVIRFLPTRPIRKESSSSSSFDDDDSTARSIVTICSGLHKNMGFHPQMYRSDSGCSIRQEWSMCWTRECIELLQQEWSCGLLDGNCPTPYQKTLYQVRHPLRVIESLATKFCISGLDSGTVHPLFVKMSQALFPQHDFSSMGCVEAAGYYTLEYNNAMLQAKKNGYVDGSFKVEETTPCEIAQQAGFLDASSIVYQPHQERLEKLCDSSSSTLNNIPAAQKPMNSTKYLINKGQLTLGWDDLLGGRHGSQRSPTNDSLQKAIKALAKELDY